MLPKVTKTPEKSSKASDSESKRHKEAEKSIGLKFNAEDIKFAESLNRKRKNDENSDSEPDTKEDNTKLVKKIKKKEHNITSLSSKLDYKCNEKNDIKSNNKGDIHSEAEDFVFFLNEISASSQDPASKFCTKEKTREHQNKRENDCNESVDASLSTVQKVIKSQSTKSEKCDKTSESESSGQNQNANFRKTLNDRAEKIGIDMKESKFKSKRRRRIIMSSDSETKDEDKNFEHDFQAKDNNSNVNSKFTNTKVETETKKHILEENFNDKLNFKSTCIIKHKNSESDAIESIISKSDSESKIIEDDEDWNQKPTRIKSQNTQKSKSKVKDNHKSSESDSELIEVVSSKASNSESEKVNNIILSHKFYRKKSQKSAVNKQYEKSESDSTEVTSSKASDLESVEVDKKVLRNKCYKKKLQEKSISISKSDVNKPHERTESDLIEESSSKSSDTESKKNIRNTLNPKSQRRKSQDKFTSIVKIKVNENVEKSESDSTKGSSSKTSDSKINKVDECSNNHKSQTRQSHDKSTYISKTNIDRIQKISESDSIRIDSSKASDSESEEVDQTNLNNNSQREESQDKSSPILVINLDKKLSESDSDSIEVASGKNSDSETEEINQNTLNNSQRWKSQTVKSKVDWKQKTSESGSIQVASSTASDSESEEINQNSLNYNSQRKKSRRLKGEVDSKQKTPESDSIKVASSKASDSESEKVNQNTSNYNSQSRKSQDKSSSVLTNNLDKKQTESDSSSSQHSESEPDKIDKNVSSSNSRKINLRNKSDSKSNYSKQKRKLRNSESDTIDVVNAEVSDSVSEQINETISKHKSPKRKSQGGSDLNSKKPKKQKVTLLDAFFKKCVTEDKVSETSDVSDFNLELEEEEEHYITEDIDLDEEDDKVEIGNAYVARTSYWPTNQELMKLKSMHIILKHDAPPQHNIEKTSGTRNLSKEEKQEFEKYNILRQGTFTKIEDQILKRNWLKFCKLHDWDVNNPKPFLHMKYKNKEFFLSRRQDRMKFVQFLANGLFDRSLYSVYQRFKIIFEPHKVTRYKPEEDSIILDFMRKNQNQGDETFVNSKDRKFADLALILRRTRASVWRRYKVLQKKQEKKKTRDRDSDILSDSY